MIPSIASNIRDHKQLKDKEKLVDRDLKFRKRKDKWMERVMRGEADIGSEKERD